DQLTEVTTLSLHDALPIYGIAINNVSATRINQITTSFQIGILISVAKIQGIKAEKKIIAEILVIATTNFTSIAAFTTNNDGKNISMIDIMVDFANKGLSSIGKI